MQRAIYLKKYVTTFAFSHLNFARGEFERAWQRLVEWGVSAEIWVGVIEPTISVWARCLPGNDKR